jgi:hypothetical protein
MDEHVPLPRLAELNAEDKARDPGENPRMVGPWLSWTTIAYLATPVMIFLGGWLKPIWAVPAIACVAVIAAGMASSRGGHTAASLREPRLKWWQPGAVLLVLAVVVGTNGPGGFGIQTWDWSKHNAVLRDLVDRPWPVVYTAGKDEVALTYYIAYYLPSAVVGKALGWKVANVAIYLWTVLGCFLAALWLMLLSRACWWAALAMLVLFSGMDLIGDVFWSHHQEPLRWLNDFDTEWWGRLWTYPSNLTLIAHAPNQAIAGWLFTALLVSALRAQAASFPIVGMLAVSLLWSPFLTVGLLALTGLWLFGHRSQWPDWLRSLRRLTNLAAVPLGLVFVLYFQSRCLTIELPTALHSPHRIMEMGEFYFMTQRVPNSEFIVAYSMFVTLEFGLLALMLWKAMRWDAQADRMLLGAAVVVLLVLPWFHYGHYNDLAMRVCIPAFYLLQIASLRFLAGSQDNDSPRKHLRLRVVVATILAVGALYPLNMLRITAVRLKERSWQVVAIPSRQHAPDLFEQQRQLRKSFYFIAQYVGSTESWFFRWLAKERPVVYSR